MLSLSICCTLQSRIFFAHRPLHLLNVFLQLRIACFEHLLALLKLLHRVCVFLLIFVSQALDLSLQTLNRSVVSRLNVLLFLEPLVVTPFLLVFRRRVNLPQELQPIDPMMTTRQGAGANQFAAVCMAVVQRILTTWTSAALNHAVFVRPHFEPVDVVATSSLDLHNPLIIRQRQLPRVSLFPSGFKLVLPFAVHFECDRGHHVRI
mmetsp:Transcript_31138/g.50528  ORF Transcript_31138/g.50528 Transcript_31138/m.50528 type:complete len:206 (+) Transcript_31138:591-1208(+)